ncbi:MAG: GNAT family N-acetyltransferase [Proteobacteria bacterium]|nr:GNAT family N-acetyltransferase [Pseudomonadota bacterium]
MIIEQADIADAGEILALQKLAYQSEAERYDDYSIPPLLQTLEEIKIDFENQRVLKVAVDRKIVGSVRAYLSGKTCFIGRLIVHPDFQSRGIGTRLMYRIQSDFIEAERFELFTGHASDNALRIYGRLGYKKFKSVKLSTHTLVFLEKFV